MLYPLHLHRLPFICSVAELSRYRNLGVYETHLSTLVLPWLAKPLAWIYGYTHVARQILFMSHYSAGRPRSQPPWTRMPLAVFMAFESSKKNEARMCSLSQLLKPMLLASPRTWPKCHDPFKYPQQRGEAPCLQPLACT